MDEVIDALPRIGARAAGDAVAKDAELESLRQLISEAAARRDMAEVVRLGACIRVRVETLVLGALERVGVQ